MAEVPIGPTAAVLGSMGGILDMAGYSRSSPGTCATSWSSCSHMLQFAHEQPISLRTGRLERSQCPEDCAPLLIHKSEASLGGLHGRGAPWRCVNEIVLGLTVQLRSCWSADV